MCFRKNFAIEFSNNKTSVLLYEKTFSWIISERFKKLGSFGRKMIFVLFAPIMTTIEEVTQSRSMMRASQNVLKIKEKSRKKINSIREYYLNLERYNDHLNHVMTRESSIQLVLQLSVLIDQYNSFPASDLIYDERKDAKSRFE